MSRNRLDYHLMPVSGWMNDPNGLCRYQGLYHIFFQQDRNSFEGKEKEWGHYTTADMIHYDYLGTAIKPDSEADCDGAYSGCGVPDGDTLRLFYTGNVKEIGDYDYIHAGRQHNLIEVSSHDGIHFTDKHCLMHNSDYPDDMSCHVRDPKITRIKDGWEMLLGARDSSDHGCLLRYVSQDLEHWTYTDRYYPDQDQPFMLECPNRINEEILLACPQGNRRDPHWDNVYDAGFYTLKDGRLTDYQRADYGFDYYAPSILEDGDRRILFGWMGMPDAEYINPTRAEGWQHAMTLPRDITVKHGRVYQTVIPELKKLERQTVTMTQSSGTFAKTSKLDMKINGKFELDLNKISLQYDGSTLMMDLSYCGCGRGQRRITNLDLQKLCIYVDHSCIELFINDGEYTMTSRFYDDENQLAVHSQGIKQIQVTELGAFTVRIR